MPTMPPAPERLSTITRCFSRVSSSGASRRATISVLPPGGQGMTTRIGFSGQPAAKVKDSGAPKASRRPMMPRPSDLAFIVASSVERPCRNYNDPRMHWLLLPGLLAIGAIVAGAAAGQDFPVKPIRIITSAPGGSSDFTARLIAQGWTESLGQQAVVDNRGNFGGEQLAKAPPDGYTLLVDGASLWTGPLIQKTSYDPVRDFSSVTIAVSAPSVIVVHPSLPVKSIKELIALARARPGALNYGSGGIGGASHLPAELFKSMAGINIVNVNYKGTGQAVVALISGEIQ